MRGLGHPDTFLTNDLGVRHALDRLGLERRPVERWAPWRSYAVHHLWASLGGTADPPARNERDTMTDELFSTVIDSPVGDAHDRGQRPWPAGGAVAR